MKVSNTCNKL